MREELDASRDRIARLNANIIDERRAHLKEAERLEKHLADRERALTDAYSRRESELEQRLKSQEERLQRRERDVFAMRAKFEVSAEERQKELDATKSALDERVAAFEVEVARYGTDSQQKLQTNSKTFVSGMVSELRKKEVVLSRISLAWSLVGGGILVLGTILLGWVTYLSVEQAGVEMSWSLLTFYALKGTVLVGIAGIASRYAFVMAANYMSEALRTADRVHAIKFGQFYVETYGAASTWEQVKETFSNWNGASSGSWGSLPSSDASGASASDLTSAITSIVGLAKKE